MPATHMAMPHALRSAALFRVRHSAVSVSDEHFEFDSHSVICDLVIQMDRIGLLRAGYACMPVWIDFRLKFSLAARLADSHSN
jgi:hypothetical protein